MTPSEHEAVDLKVLSEFAVSHPMWVPEGVSQHTSLSNGSLRSTGNTYLLMGHPEAHLRIEIVRTNFGLQGMLSSWLTVDGSSVQVRSGTQIPNNTLSEHVSWLHQGLQEALGLDPLDLPRLAGESSSRVAVLVARSILAGDPVAWAGILEAMSSVPQKLSYI
jgi:hypothetical protein